MRLTLPNHAVSRLSVGLAQGIALSLLYQSVQQKIWPATNGSVFALLVTVAFFVPTLVISGLGNLRPRTLLVWGAVATAICAGLAYYDIVRDPVTLIGIPQMPRIVPTGTMWLSLAAILFIVHTLTVAGDADRRVIATYPTHFDASWKHGVQFVLAICFVAVLWGLLFLGSELFRLIRLEFFATLIRKQTFYIPVTALAFACALHVTDVRASIVQGTRTLLLVLLSWLLPLMALIAAGFVVALAFTGLTPLWGTRWAARILLIAAAALIFLINAAHQDGRVDDRTAALLRYAKVLAAIAIVPLTVLTAIALYLRVVQYGWTPDRIIATACVVVAAFYAAGYVYAAARAGAAMKALESTNVMTALVIVGVLLMLRSPVLDPARISVADQVHRLEAGIITPEQFDFAFLRYRAGRFGTDELERLAARPQGSQAAAIAERANQARRANTPYQATHPLPAISQEMRARNITVVQPSGGVLPDSFLRETWTSVSRPFLVPRCLVADAKCEAILTDLDGDGQPEVLLFVPPAGGGTAFKATSDNHWEMLGTLTNAFCPGVRDALKAGQFEVQAPPLKDLIVNGQRLRVSDFGCNPKPQAAPGSPNGTRPAP
jgi:hypothetical protein